MPTIPSLLAAVAAFATIITLPAAAITIDDFKPTSLSGSGKTLELNIEGDDLNGPKPGATWALTFEKSPANQATIRNFPGSAAASTTTWAYAGPPFKDAHGYTLAETAAFGNKAGKLDLWISEDGAKFYLTIDGNGYYGGVAFKSLSEPEINVYQPSTSKLSDGKTTKSFGTMAVGKAGTARKFIIKNTGNATLKKLAIKKDGSHAKDFIVGALSKTSLAAGESTSFNVTFKPSAKGTRKAAIHIASNDADENPFDIKLSGEGAAK